MATNFDFTDEGYVVPASNSANFKFGVSTASRLDVTVAWEAKQEFELDTAWSLTSLLSIDTAWQFLTGLECITSWRIQPALSVETAWYHIQQLDIETSWKIRTCSTWDTSWKLLNDDGSIPGEDTHDIILAVAGESFSCEKCTLAVDIDSVSWTGSLTIVDEDVYGLLQYGQSLEITIDAVTWNLFVKDRKVKSEFPTKSWGVTVVSEFAMIKDNLINYTTKNAPIDVREVMSSICPIPFSWEIDRYDLPKNTIIADSDKIGTIILKLIEAGGGKLICSPNGLLHIIYEYKKIHAAHSSLDPSSFYSTSFEIKNNIKYSGVLVRTEGLQVSRDFNITEIYTDLVNRKKYISISVNASNGVYDPQALRGDARDENRPIFQSSSASDIEVHEISRLPSEVLDYVNEGYSSSSNIAIITEQISIKGGYGFASNTIQSIQDYEYIAFNNELGTIHKSRNSKGESSNGIVTHEIGNSIVELTYTSPAFLYEIEYNTDEEVSSILCFKSDPISKNIVREIIATGSDQISHYAPKMSPDILILPFFAPDDAVEEHPQFVRMGSAYLYKHRGDLGVMTAELIWKGTKIPDVCEHIAFQITDHLICYREVVSIRIDWSFPAIDYTLEFEWCTDAQY